MTGLEKAARLALEALEEAHWKLEHKQDRNKRAKAITALTAALEQPAPPPECKTDAEKTAYAFGWFKALEANRGQSAQGKSFYLNSEQPAPATEPLTDEQCDAIYYALDVWSREFDQHEFGLPATCGGGMEGGREIIRAAYGIHAPTERGEKK